MPSDRPTGVAAVGLPPMPARPAHGRDRYLGLFALLVVVGLVIFSWQDVNGSVNQLVKGFFGSRGLIRDVVPSSVPPDLGQFWDGVKAAVLTFAIAFLSIVLGVIFSVAMLPLAARNITPSRPLYELTRLIMAIFRAVPELIMLELFQVVMGFSAFSAVVALTFHGVGVKGKLFAEAVEEMDMASVDALRVAGAGRIQVFLHAVLPTVRGTLTGLTLYRLDANFRSAVTLGVVGAGGIGFLIGNDLAIFQFKIVCTYLIVVVLAVMGIERVSTILRERLT